MAASFTASDVWAQAFVKRLMEIRPDLDLAEIIIACQEVFAQASRMEPGEAAEMFALRCLPANDRTA
jgi:hypothetical protein